MLNWVLGTVAVSLWGGVMVRHFWKDVAQLWRTRNDKWFRNG